MPLSSYGQQLRRQIIMVWTGKGTFCFLLVCSHSFAVFASYSDIRDIRKLQASSITLECNDASSVKNKWKQNEKFLFAGNYPIATNLQGITLHKQNYSLQIHNVSFNHEGLYICIRNASIVRRFNVIVEVKPDLIIVVNGRKVTSEVVFQEKILAQCNALGAKPAVNLTWVINNKRRESTDVECNYSKGGDNHTFDCTTDINMDILDKSGNLTCMTSDDLLFGGSEISIVFSINESKIDIPKISDDYLEPEAEGTEKPDFEAPKWFIAFVILPLSAVLGIGIHSYWKHKETEPLELPPRNPPRNNCFTSTEINETYHIAVEDYVTVEPSAIQSVSHCEKMSPQDMENITLGEQLHADGFFDHWMATITPENTMVVAKSLTENSQISDLYVFQEIANCLNSLPKHENVAEILGVSTSKVPSYIYQEYVDRGNLREFLLKYYQQSRYSQIQALDKKQNFGIGSNRLQDKIRFCFQIADGMTFLVHNKFCHPALSANKVLLNSTGNCKLYDFWPESSSKLRVDRLLIKENPPVAWLAPETIFFSQYSKESDVWSFSILLWEIYSSGDIPYRGLAKNEIEATLRKSCFLDRPPDCPGGMFNLMLSSWNLSMKDRPSFHQLRDKFESFGGRMSKDSPPAQAFKADTKIPQYSVVNK